MRRWIVTDVWRVLQAIGASLVIATALVLFDGVVIADPCDICAEVHPWWMCLLIGCGW